MEDIMGKDIHEEVKESSTSEEIEERSSGFIDHLLPKLVFEKQVKEEEEEEEKENGQSSNENKDEEKRGGIISHIISNLVSPMSPKAGDFSSHTVGGGDLRNNEESSEDLGRSGGGGGGGVMKDIISNLFHHNSEDHGKQSDEESLENKNINEENGFKGGFIDNIVSHFPTSIPDDAVPTTDEASILIHSIVKD